MRDRERAKSRPVVKHTTYANVALKRNVLKTPLPKLIKADKNKKYNTDETISNPKRCCNTCFMQALLCIAEQQPSL